METGTTTLETGTNSQDAGNTTEEAGTTTTQEAGECAPCAVPLHGGMASLTRDCPCRRQGQGGPHHHPGDRHQQPDW